MLTPTALMELGASTGCDAIALTDHDTTDGLAEAADAARRLDLRFIQGVEISVTWPMRPAPGTRHADIKPVTLHIVATIQKAHRIILFFPGILHDGSLICFVQQTLP